MVNIVLFQKTQLLYEGK